MVKIKYTKKYYTNARNVTVIINYAEKSVPATSLLHYYIPCKEIKKNPGKVIFVFFLVQTFCCLLVFNRMINAVNSSF